MKSEHYPISRQLKNGRKSGDYSGNSLLQNLLRLNGSVILNLNDEHPKGVHYCCCNNKNQLNDFRRRNNLTKNLVKMGDHVRNMMENIYSAFVLQYFYQMHSKHTAHGQTVIYNQIMFTFY